MIIAAVSLFEAGLFEGRFLGEMPPKKKVAKPRDRPSRPRVARPPQPAPSLGLGLESGWFLADLQNGT